MNSCVKHCVKQNSKCFTKYHVERSAEQSAKRSNERCVKRFVKCLVRHDDEGSGTISGVALIAVAAIGVIAWILVDQGATNPANQNMITVPNLENKSWDEAVMATDYVVKLDVYAYSNIYEKGKIISQEPAANTQIT